MALSVAVSQRSPSGLRRGCTRLSRRTRRPRTARRSRPRRRVPSRSHGPVPAASDSRRCYIRWRIHPSVRRPLRTVRRSTRHRSDGTGLRCSSPPASAAHRRYRLCTIVPRWPTATKRSAPHVTSRSVFEVALSLAGVQRSPSRLCTIVPFQPTATKRSLPRATLSKRPRTLADRQRPPSGLCTISPCATATKRPAPQATSLNHRVELPLASTQWSPSSLDTMVPSSPTAMKRSPFEATASRRPPVVPRGDLKPPPRRTKAHATLPSSPGSESASCCFSEGEPATGTETAISRPTMPIPTPPRSGLILVTAGYGNGGRRAILLACRR